MVMQAAPWDLIDALSRASVVVFLVIVIYGGYKRWWVFGWQFQDLEKRHVKQAERLEQAVENADKWKETALKAAAAAERGSTIAEIAVKRGLDVSDG